MSKRRLLPEAAYDFWTWDGYDGKTTPERDTYAEAKSDLKVVRAKLDWCDRCRVRLKWAVNERKVLRLLSTGAP